MREYIENEIIDESGETANAGENAGANAEAQRKTEKKYTEEEVDRIISKRLERERKRVQRALESEQQESELEKREKRVLLRELKADAKDELQRKGLPAALADFLDYSNKEAMVNSIDTVGNAFAAAVEQGVKSRIKGKTPFGRSGISGDESIRNAFKL